jgi:Protein of unknown function (DUF1761)
MMTKINHLAVIVAAIAYFVWGAVWFGVFGPPWRAATGITVVNITPTTYVVSFLMGLLLAYAIAVALKDSTNPNMLRHGIEFAVFMSGAFWLAQLLNVSLYEGKPLVLWAIDGFYVVTGSAIMAAIIGAWRKRA